MKILSLHPRPRRGYTLIEVLAASAVIAVSMAAATSLAASMVFQEELAWRTAITRNYQENMARLWQLGLSPANILAVMPTQNDSTLLNEAINLTPVVTETNMVSPDGLGKLQAATISASVNISSDPKVEVQGAAFTLSVYRASLPAALRSTTLP